MDIASVCFSSSKIEGGSDQHFILISSTNTCHCYRWMWAVNSASGHQSVLPGGPQRVLQMKERFMGQDTPRGGEERGCGGWGAAGHATFSFSFHGAGGTWGHWGVPCSFRYTSCT